MSFKYSLFDRIELEATTTNKGRVYHTPAGDFRSVTTVLGDKLKSKKLAEWRGSVGTAEADQITQQAMFRGNDVHMMCEEYLKGNTEFGSPYSELNGTRLMPSNLEMFLQVKPILDKSITCIYGVEFPLYSIKLRTAGRADGIVEWRNQNAVIDFKTVRRPLEVDDERIAKFHLQVTVYAMMIEEMYSDWSFSNNVIVVVPADGDYPQIFVRSNLKLRPFVERIFQ